jgi:hypothetical protein
VPVILTTAWWLQAVSMLGVWTASAVTWAMVKLNIVGLPHASQVTREFYMKSIVPIGITSAGTIYFGNLAYLYLGVSFVQICKAFGPVITMVVGFGLGTDKPTPLLIVAILLIAGGTSAAVSGQSKFSWFGFIVIMLAQLSEGVKLILQQVINATQHIFFSALNDQTFGCQLLTAGKMKFTIWEGLYYTSPVCGFVLLLGND